MSSEHVYDRSLCAEPSIAEVTTGEWHHLAVKPCGEASTVRSEPGADRPFGYCRAHAERRLYRLGVMIVVDLAERLPCAETRQMHDALTAALEAS